MKLTPNEKQQRESERKKALKEKERLKTLKKYLPKLPDTGKPPLWEIYKIVGKGGYLYAVVNEHPHAIKGGYVLLHRIIMENFTGKMLSPNEVVHHKNGNSMDNRIENLEIMDRGEHHRYHASLVGRKWVKIKCPVCGKIFDQPKNKSYLCKGHKTSCCSTEHAHNLQSQISKGMTKKLKKALSENLVEIYVKYLYNPDGTKNQDT